MGCSPEETGVQIWNVASGQHERTYDVEWNWPHPFPDKTLEFLPNGRAVALKSDVQPSHLFDLSLPRTHNTKRRPREILERDGDRVASWDKDASAIVVRRLGHGQPEPISQRAYHDGLKTSAGENPRPIRFTPDGNLLVYVEEHPGQGVAPWLSGWLPSQKPHGYYDVVDPETGRLVRRIAGPLGTYVVGLTPDMKTLATKEFWVGQESIALWDVPLGAPWGTILGWPLIPAALIVGARRLEATRVVVRLLELCG